MLDYSKTAIYRSSIHYFILASGCLLAILLHYRRGYLLLRPLTHPLFGLPIVAVFCWFHTNLEPFWTASRNALLILVAYAAATMALLVVLVAPGPVGWLLSTRPLRFVGERSYSLYLLQTPVHFVVVQAVPGLAQSRTTTGVTVFVVALAIADLIHRWVEQPMIDFGKRLIARRDLRIELGRTAAPAVA